MFVFVCRMASCGEASAPEKPRAAEGGVVGTGLTMEYTQGLSEDHFMLKRNDICRSIVDIELVTKYFLKVKIGR